MMKTIRILVASVLFTSLTASAGGTVPKDDPLVLLFENARQTVASKISQLQSCSFMAGTRPDAVAWILAHESDLSHDVLGSEHMWFTDLKSTCAFTQTQSESPIGLSYPACQPYATLEQAERILVQESFYHFGTADQDLGGAVADAVLSASASCPCPGDPFSPDSCTGATITLSDAKKYFPVGSDKSVVVGNWQIVERSRHCNQLSGCTAWTINTNPTFYSQTGNFQGNLGTIVLDTYNRPNGSLDLEIDLDADAAQGSPRIQTGAPQASGNQSSSPLNSTFGFYLEAGRGTGQRFYVTDENGGYIQMQAVMTNHCLRGAWGSRSNESSTSDWNEDEYVMISHF